MQTASATTSSSAVENAVSTSTRGGYVTQTECWLITARPSWTKPDLEGYQEKNPIVARGQDFFWMSTSTMGGGGRTDWIKFGSNIEEFSLGGLGENIHKLLGGRVL